MALLTAYNDTNKVTNNALNVKYSIEMGTMTQKVYPSKGSSSGSSGGIQYVDTPYYRVTRYAQKQYEYVGMDYATAVSCQNAKIQQYTRSYSRIVEILSSDPTWEPPQDDPEATAPQYTVLSSQPIIACTSDIVATHQEGCMWSVRITVNETDEKSSMELPYNAASLFTAENQRNYDN